jgi:hypothetical protein
MSGENPDSDDNRSRSIFRQVRETIGSMNRSRHRGDKRNASPPITLVNNKHGSADNIDTQGLQSKIHLKIPTPVSFSHHLSLLNQVKSHINKARKSHQTTSLSPDIDDYVHLSLSPVVSI